MPRVHILEGLYGILVFIEGAAADTHLAGSVAHGGGLAYLQHPFGLCYPEKDLRQSVGGD